MIKTVVLLSILACASAVSYLVPLNIMGLGFFGFFCAVFKEHFGWKKIYAIYLLPQIINVALYYPMLYALESTFGNTAQYFNTFMHETINFTSTESNNILINFYITNPHGMLIILLVAYFVLSLILLRALNYTLHKLGFFDRIHFGGYTK